MNWDYICHSIPRTPPKAKRLILLNRMETTQWETLESTKQVLLGMLTLNIRRSRLYHKRDGRDEQEEDYQPPTWDIQREVSISRSLQVVQGQAKENHDTMKYESAIDRWICKLHEQNSNRSPVPPKTWGQELYGVHRLVLHRKLKKILLFQNKAYTILVLINNPTRIWTRIKLEKS